LTGNLVRICSTVAILTVLSSCSPDPESQLPLAPTDSPNTAQAHIQKPGAPELDKIGNTTFYGIYEHPITLIDGHWEGEPYAAGGASRPTVGLISNFYLTGDLDGDGSEEAVAMLWQSSGGSGVFSYLAVFAWRNGEIVNTGTASIGDRVQVRSTQIDGKQIIINVVQQGPDDAACCPSQKATRYWSMTKDKLQEGPAQIEGQMAITDIAEKEWQLIQFDHNEPLPESVLVTLLIEGNRLAGQAPCNRYFAGVEAGDGVGAINIGQAGATRMVCPDPLMSLEQRYFKLLSGVTRYSFVTGQLALSWQSADEQGTMFFK